MGQFFGTCIANKNDDIVAKTAKIQEDYLQIINQYEEESGSYDTRYDVTIFVNGLPLVHIEIKRRGGQLKEAFNQINRYRRDSFRADSNNRTINDLIDFTSEKMLMVVDTSGTPQAQARPSHLSRR